jgi:prepilin-type N-terminal cleavage/methylation domain-containing protein/prepilin-type processing-associated H-X9-DG protein
LRQRFKGFTLTELLVALGIILVLALILFPVFTQVKAAAQKAVCASNLHQASLAMELYVGDYDDYYTPVNYEPGAGPDPVNDRTWVQLLLPYARSFEIFKDPGDTGRGAASNDSFDEDLVPYNTYESYYLASLRSDIGFNYIYLSPVVKQGNIWRSEPQMMASITDPSKTIMFVDSVWARDSGGSPVGGGNWLVTPPCRLEVDSGAIVDSFGMTDGEEIFSMSHGWSGNNSSPAVYGNAWPWHSGMLNVARVDGSVKAIPLPTLSQGCDAQPLWKGLIVDSDQYIWSSR